MTPILTPEQRTLWRDLLSRARHIVITGHRGPDGDAIGSATALASWLRRSWDADVRIIMPNYFPDFLHWVPLADEILLYDKHEAEVQPIIEQADLVILCDHGELSRMWTLGDAIRNHPTPRIIIDHHPSPEPDIADLLICHPELSSCCEVLLRTILEIESPTTPASAVLSPSTPEATPTSASILPNPASTTPSPSAPASPLSLSATPSPSPQAPLSTSATLPPPTPAPPSALVAAVPRAFPPGYLLPPPLTHDEAVSLYTGMMTDTGAFTYASNRPEVYELISILLRCGIDKDRIYRNVFFTYSPNRMKFQGYMLYAKLNVWKKAHTAIMTLTNAERRRFGILNGDTEGLVNMPLQIQGIKLSIFLREDTEQPCIRLSLRSVDDFPCNKLAAEFFGGGGHLNAAGGEFWGNINDAVEVAKRAVQKYISLLKE